ncbi:hypothetical protein Q426_03445 [Streptococcus equi subsp. zooepidemicus CY]|nr:hypothetical protein Q426_03445 [Streptococcus equi subsp. zooepidemicus CY]
MSSCVPVLLNLLVNREIFLVEFFEEALNEIKGNC